VTGGGWYHCRMGVIGRSAGRSAVAAAAYRLGERLHEQETDRTHDYTRRHGVVTWFGIAPEHSPAWGTDAERLWNAVHARDGRSNAQLAREWELALPAAVSADDREGIARAFAQELVDRYGAAVTVAIHEPGRGDDRNFHAHIMMTTRRMGEDGLGEKIRELVTKNTGAQEVRYLREYACDLINGALERIGLEERVDHRSFEERGIEREPTTHLGPKAAAMERRGVESDRGDVNRETADRNQLDQLVTELAALDEEIAREQQARVFGEGFEWFEPHPIELDPLDPETWPQLTPDAGAEEIQVSADAAPFAHDIEERGHVREIEQDGGLTWWERSAQLVMDAFDQARGYARDTWERFVGREDRDRDIDNGPDMG
jgi:hypothetical protein